MNLWANGILPPYIRQVKEGIDTKVVTAESAFFVNFGKPCFASNDCVGLISKKTKTEAVNCKDEVKQNSKPV